MSKADKLTPAIHSALGEVLNTHLRQHPIWQNDFFTAIDRELNHKKRWSLLEKWIDQMPHASYGFTTYVSHLAARTTDTEVRELLVQNLHEEHTSPASHFKMICGLKAKVQGSENSLAHDFPSLLPTSRAHVETHTSVAKDGDYFEGLGTLLLIENLTAEEFRRVREACGKTWVKLGKKPTNFFNGGGGEGYFKANENADECHAIDMMIAVQEAIRAEGVDVNDPAAIKPYIQRITQGVITSITCRNNFTQGVYDAVYKDKSQDPFKFNLQDGETLVANNGEVTISFRIDGLVPEGDSKEGGNPKPVSIIPIADITIDSASYEQVDLISCTADIAKIIAAVCLQGKRDNNLDWRIKNAFCDLENQIPKQVQP